MSEQAAQEEKRWSTLSTKDKIGEWATQHQYSMILGSWALSLATAGAIISRDRYQTIPQKVVQARMWAQGLTIGVLIVAGALTHTRASEAAKRVTYTQFISRKLCRLTHAPFFSRKLITRGLRSCVLHTHVDGHCLLTISQLEQQEREKKELKVPTMGSYEIR